MQILLGNYEIETIIIKKNNKNIYFRFKEDNKLYITCNRFITESKIKSLIKENEKSLLRMYEASKKKNELSKRYYYLGNPYIKVYQDDIKKLFIDEDMLYIKDDKMLLKWEKEECIRIFTERINALLPQFTNIPKFSLRIRSMKTRWGVNNVTKRIITLNSELLKKDITLIDYVIIHELCHFYEANHSSKFWYQVSLRYPEYKLARKRLREE